MNNDIKDEKKYSLASYGKKNIMGRKLEKRPFYWASN